MSEQNEQETTSEQREPTPPEHARDDAESVEQAETTQRTSGNGADDAPAVAGVTLYGEQLPVELRYDKVGPEVTVTVGDQRHQIANLYRFQLTHDAKDALPKLAFWSYPLDGSRALSLEAAELYDVRALERAVERAVVHAASAREYGRALAVAVARLVVDEYGPGQQPPYRTILRFVEEAHSKLLMAAPRNDAGPTLGDAITRAWLLAEDARRVADDDTLRAKLGADGADTTMRDLLRSLADATMVVTERLAALTVHGPEAAAFRSEQQQHAADAQAIVSRSLSGGTDA